jgi:hypothetical protein
LTARIGQDVVGGFGPYEWVAALVSGPEGISLPMQLKVPDDCERVSGRGMVESDWLYKIEIGRAEAV